ncbi:hypothetical protein HanIR_Chr16g0831771 [Helianthus annuus]|nr:hypothetical protein HanIR_Chr16g0831771 [Helianthus annuus]
MHEFSKLMNRGRTLEHKLFTPVRNLQPAHDLYKNLHLQPAPIPWMNSHTVREGVHRISQVVLTGDEWF